jgi:hypothetical protein
MHFDASPPLEIAQRFSAGKTALHASGVPQGRKKGRSAVPAGLAFFWLGDPSAEALGYFLSAKVHDTL